MVLENDPVYNAIQIVSENGYVIINQDFCNIIIPIGVAIVFGLGFFVGYREWKKENDKRSVRKT